MTHKISAFGIMSLVMISLQLTACQRAKLGPGASMPKVDGPKLASPGSKSDTAPAPAASPVAAPTKRTVEKKDEETKQIPLESATTLAGSGKDVSPATQTIPLEDSNKKTILLAPIKVQGSNTAPAKQKTVKNELAYNASLEQEILFVVDSSASMHKLRSILARSAHALVTPIPENVQIRIGVLPTVGAQHPEHGRLINVDGNIWNTVLKSEAMTWPSFKWELARKFARLPHDTGFQGGNWGMTSLQKALDDTREKNPNIGSGFVEVLNAGLFRPHVNKAIVFVADSHDACLDPSIYNSVHQPCSKTSVIQLDKQIIRRKYGGDIQIFSVLIDTQNFANLNDIQSYADLTHVGRGQTIAVTPGNLDKVFYDIGRSLYRHKNVNGASNAPQARPLSGKSTTDLNGIY